MPSPSEEESPDPSPVSSIFEEESFQSQYRILRTIGHGSNAKVQLAHHRLTGTPVAVKVLQKKKWCQPIRSEVEIMMITNHPNIISLIQVIESEKRTYLVMELAEGQQLYQYVRKAGHLPEHEARGIFRQIIAGVSYCHDQGIIHRDLKPDNIMLDEKGKVKIIDFGLGTQVKPGQRLSRHCGAYSFGAPELFLGRLYDGPKVDIWTLGVVLYFMVVGKVPFGAVNIPELRRQVVSGKYTVPLGLSEELQDLLSLLMTVNPRLRPTVDEVKTHPWLRKDMEALPNHCEEMVPSLLDPAIVKAMEHIGFQAQDIKDSLHQRKFDQTMASYCLLQGQALRGPLQRTPTLDQVHHHARSAPCIYSKSSISEDTEDSSCSHSASAEGKSTHSRGQRRGLRAWTRRVGNAVTRLCCCCPSKKKPRRGQNSVSPQK
ncbi:sperm motility kinase Y-like [Peromyscus californicus insignis]|uniref:sperm motility kinase Y-like n=1 Tax=Peromyscus californicus insignis TaxID=564181 RepID=UPI0022A65E17|nr:sperm motility kinase Y-like [Peromyscus californicus insignis]